MAGSRARVPGREHIFLSACLSPSQTKDALLKILEDVKQDDYLNFILFSGDVTTWKDSLVPVTPENIQEARNFVMDIQDRGCKNRGEGATSCRSSLPEQPVSLLPWQQRLCWSRPCRSKLWIEVGWRVLRLDIAVSSLWSRETHFFPTCDLHKVMTQRTLIPGSFL